MSGEASCAQGGPNAKASMVLVEGDGGCGAFQRNCPTGGRAKGTPSQARAPLLSVKPTTSPDCVLLRVASLRSGGGSGAGRLLT